MTTIATTPPLTILRKEYLTLVDQLIDEAQLSVSRAIRYCAAKLLNIFQRLTAWKQTAYSLPIERCLFWIPIFKKPPKDSSEQQTISFEMDGYPDDPARRQMPRSLYDELQGEHCRETISKAVHLLKSLGLVEVNYNPYNRQDRTYWYRLVLDRVPTPQIDSSISRNDASTPKIDESISEVETSRMITESRSESGSDFFSQTTNAVAAEQRVVSEPAPEPQPYRSVELQEIEGSDRQIAPQAGEERCSAAAPPTEILQRMQTLGIECNKNVQQRMKQFGDRIVDALNYVGEQQKLWSVVNPTGLFMQAIKRGDRPSENYRPPEKQVSAYHDPTQFWAYLSPASDTYKREGIEQLVAWLNHLWQVETAEQLVRYLLRESEWGWEVEIDPAGFLEIKP
jgi:hypothetical protein